MPRTYSIIFAFCVLGLMGLWTWWGSLPRSVSARLGDAQLTLERVSSGEDRERGLSGRVSLAANQGMLFVFNTADRYAFWMKDMRFPIDILWLDADYRIIDVDQDVQPDSYPKTFSPRVPARYVLELPAGFFVKHDLMLGNMLEILP